MGYQTDYIGYLRIDPPLTEREEDVVNSISRSIFLDAPRGGLHVVDALDSDLHRLMADAPRGWSNWTACTQGCCLTYDGGDKANYMVGWLRFLVSTFFAPGAPGSQVAGMGGEHGLTGMVVGSRRDTRELFAIVADGSTIEVELLWPGKPDWSDYPRLAYQEQIDRFRQWVIDENRG